MPGKPHAKALHAAKAKAKPATPVRVDTIDQLTFDLHRDYPLHVGTSRIYTARAQQRFRLYAKPGDKVEASTFSFKQKMPEQVWSDVVEKVKALNPSIPLH